MIKINTEQLTSKLDSLKQQQKLLPYYFLVGTEPYLQHQAQTVLQQNLKQAGFEEQYIFTIDAQTDWNKIYDHCQSLSLFSSQTLLVLLFGENGVNTTITAKLNELIPLLNPDIALILSLGKITKPQENSVWFKALSEQSLWVNCTAPDTAGLPQWLNQQAQAKGLKLEPQSIELLSYYYEGNLLALSQILEQLILLFPEGKVSFEQIENNINDSAIFTPYHWIDAILAGKTKRTMHILQQLKLNEVEVLILLRTIQRELLLLINLKRSSMPVRQAFDQYKVWQNRRPLFTQILNRLALHDLYQALNKLTQIEISLKQDYSTEIWRELESLSLLLIGKPVNA
ncbi:DNA polymerase III subunit delta [Zophobihabitans entericus]|uniref:DNA polymerase III subunit delta n=1 Tax=Zophobihabitans entericus TaxID=1635327 RepID=A0A6G9IBJ3_9GAMM|nr:DNA polymerase III subunit delta [Zophobihabitans entericus]QIQ21593.1 DNA polymerase III subunit delta [Zophobihabitans entericus]